MKKKKKIFLAAAVFLFAMAAGGKAEAAENVRGEVVFLLDASKSMDTQDRGHAAQSAVRQAAYSLPSGYRAGFVAYGTKVQAVMSLEEDIRELDGLLEALRYEGYCLWRWKPCEDGVYGLGTAFPC